MSDKDQNVIAVLPYLFEVERECQLALSAANRMAAHAEAFWPIANPPSVVGDFFDDAQRLFASAAVVGKILYVKNSGNATRSTGRADRARKLRDLLGLADSSLLASWDIRNALEHIDERIDEWVKVNPDSYGSFGISRTGNPKLPNVPRQYDSQSDVIYVWGAEAELRPVVEAITDVSAHVHAYLQRTIANYSPPGNHAAPRSRARSGRRWPVGTSPRRW